MGGDDAEEGNCEQHLGNPDYHNPLLLGGDLINDDVMIFLAVLR